MEYYVEKTCLCCGSDFIDKSTNQIGKFCSKKCKNKVNNENYPNTITGRYNTAKKEITRNRNKNKENPKKWLLSLEEYETIINDDECHYCGDDLPKYGVALDRIDSSGHYEKINVVPCCKNCNSVKHDLLTLEEMEEVVKLLKQIRNKEDIWK